jgi:hypothetical protein
MATPRKKPAEKMTAAKRVVKAKDDELTPLDIHAIQLHELYKAFRRAGFPVDISIALITDAGAHPNWFYTAVPDLEALEEEEDED